MIMKAVTNLKHWFLDVVAPLTVSDNVKVYVIDVLSRPERSDMSRESIVIARTKAVTFTDYQKIGDWALWIGTINPQHKNREVVESLGRLSYLSCYRLLGRRVTVYEELADELPHIVTQLHVRLNGCVERCNYEPIPTTPQGHQSS